MSDSNDKLDELFRNRFEEVELPVSDKLLANIKQELSIPKRKRRFGFWIWVASGIIIVAGIAGIVMYTTGNETIEKQDKKPIVEAIKSTDGDELGNQEIKEENAAITNPEQADSFAEQKQLIAEQTQEPVSVNHRNSIEVSKEQVKNTSTKDNAEPKPESAKAKVEKGNNSLAKKNQTVKDETVQITKSSETNASGPKEKSRAKKTVNNVNSINTSGQVAKDVPESSKKVVNGEQFSDTKNQIAENQATPAAAGNKEEQIKSTTEQNVSSTTDAKQSAQEDSVTATPDTSAIAEIKKETDTIKSKPKEEPKQETTQSNNFSFFVELNGGPSQSFRKMSPESNYIVMQRGAEKPEFAYNAGIDAGILYKNKYQFTMGLGIDNKGERYYFQGQEEATSYSLDSFYVYYDTIIDSTPYTDSVLTYNIDTHYTAFAAETSVKNKYQYLKIPVMFGYRFNINENWFITPNVGVIVNYLISGNSTWFDPQRQQLITYSAKKDYRTIVLAARAKIDIGYNVNEKWSILVQPGYTRFLQSIYRKEEQFKHNPYSYDLNFAVRYTFQ